jgi:hypothetical protein
LVRAQTLIAEWDQYESAEMGQPEEAEISVLQQPMPASTPKPLFHTPAIPWPNEAITVPFAFGIGSSRKLVVLIGVEEINLW